MHSNIGKIDRLIRIGAALIISFGGIYFDGLWAILGMVVLLTAIVGWCPVYAVFHRSTTKEQEQIPADTSGEHQLRQGPKRLLK